MRRSEAERGVVAMKAMFKWGADQCREEGVGRKAIGVTAISII